MGATRPPSWNFCPYRSFLRIYDLNVVLCIVTFRVSFLEAHVKVLWLKGLIWHGLSVFAPIVLTWPHGCFSMDCRCIYTDDCVLVNFFVSLQWIYGSQGWLRIWKTYPRSLWLVLKGWISKYRVPIVFNGYAIISCYITVQHCTKRYSIERSTPWLR